MLRRLSQRSELILINLICFGPLAAMAIAGLLRRETVVVFDDRRLLTIGAIELVAGTIAVLVLRARGWTAGELGLRITMPLTIAGMVLLIGSNIAIAGLVLVFTDVTGFNTAAVTTQVSRVSWLPLILLLAIDPLYEETFEVAYNLRATEREGAAFGISLSAAVRLICHLDQGPIVPLTILPLGLIFAAVYWKWRRVWPLTVAHGVGAYFALTMA
ncbi:MAG: CPBP family intramembrane metalloprotease [Acidobacteriota bacterium]|nr:CPBP family intramembrane metalloprotease [Acidobacteriota bacterium]